MCLRGEQDSRFAFIIKGTSEPKSWSGRDTLKRGLILHRFTTWWVSYIWAWWCQVGIKCIPPEQQCFSGYTLHKGKGIGYQLQKFTEIHPLQNPWGHFLAYEFSQNSFLHHVSRSHLEVQSLQEMLGTNPNPFALQRIMCFESETKLSNCHCSKSSVCSSLVQAIGTVMTDPTSVFMTIWKLFGKGSGVIQPRPGQRYLQACSVWLGFLF